MPTNDPQTGERWVVRLIPGGNKEAEVLLRATPHDMVSMPDMVVVFRYVGYPDRRAWTMTLRNFCGMFDWIPRYEPQPFASVAEPVKIPGRSDPPGVIEAYAVESVEFEAPEPPPNAQIAAPLGGAPYRYSRLMERWQRELPQADGSRVLEVLDEQTAAALWAAKWASSCAGYRPPKESESPGG